jgi:hypothetical protein
LRHLQNLCVAADFAASVIVKAICLASQKLVALVGWRSLRADDADALLGKGFDE